jgi:hypothetical protein
MVNARNPAPWRLTSSFCASVAGAFLAVTAPAAALELALPLACEPGRDCWVVRYVDRDPGPGFSDFHCGVLGADGHDGTDFALADPRRMAAGVQVLASAPGVVRGIRDRVPDQPPEGRLTHDFGAMNCGNGVLLAHDGGWETQYCHLRRGSVEVAVGDTVTAGQVLGLVGMSGEANFPHVHLSVRHDGTTVDPYTGAALPAACGLPGSTLWRTAPSYEEIPIAVIGLTDHVPERDAIVAGTAATPLERASGALVGYLLAYGLRAGDHIALKIHGPDGGLVSNATFELDQDAPRATRAAGRRAPAGGWTPGGYRVEVEVRRGTRAFSRAAEFVIAQ